jgi:hypothetical protein
MKLAVITASRLAAIRQIPDRFEARIALLTGLGNDNRARREQRVTEADG